MKVKILVIIAVLLSISMFSGATSFEELSASQQEKFKLSVDGAAIAVAGAPANAAEAALASRFAKNNPPYAKLWSYCSIVDNSAFPGGTVAYTDINIDGASNLEIQAIVGGPFAVLASMLYPDLVSE